MFCPQCGKKIQEGHAFCQYCGVRLTVEGNQDSVTHGRSKTPWEDREHIGFLNGLLRTAKDVLFTPTDFFRKMPVIGGLTDPLIYGLIIGMIGLMFFYFWDIILHESIRDFMSLEVKADAERTLFQGNGMAITAALTPFLLIIWMFIVSGMLHLFLLFVRGAKAGYEATFRVVGYCTSPLLFMLIPYCGMLITIFWVISLAIIGLKEAHEITGGKALIAVLFPFFFCCGLLVLAVVLLMGAFAASFGTMIHLFRQ